MLTAEPKKFRRLERRKLKRMLRGARPFTTLAERQEMTEMVGKALRVRRREYVCFVPNPYSGCMMDTSRSGVFGLKSLEAVRSAYFAEGPSAALAEYQKLVLKFENEIKAAHKEILESLESEGRAVII